MAPSAWASIRSSTLLPGCHAVTLLHVQNKTGASAGILTLTLRPADAHRVQVRRLYYEVFSQCGNDRPSDKDIVADVRLAVACNNSGWVCESIFDCTSESWGSRFKKMPCCCRNDHVLVFCFRCVRQECDGRFMNKRGGAPPPPTAPVRARCQSREVVDCVRARRPDDCTSTTLCAMAAKPHCR